VRPYPLLSYRSMGVPWTLYTRVVPICLEIFLAVILDVDRPVVRQLMGEAEFIQDRLLVVQRRVPREAAAVGSR